MNLALSEEQEMLKTMASDFLTDKLPKATVKEIEESEQGYSAELWKEMAGLGWIGLPRLGHIVRGDGKSLPAGALFLHGGIKRLYHSGYRH
jgi:hypothetical protein